MKFSAISSLLLASSAQKSMSQGLPYQLVGAGECRDANKEEYPYVTLWNQLIGTIQCADWCQQNIFANLVGFEYGTNDFVCRCDFSGGLPVPRPKYNPEATFYSNLNVGSGPILSANPYGRGNPYCYKFIVPTIAEFTKMGVTGSGRCVDASDNRFAEAWGPERPWVDVNEAEQFCPVYCGQNIDSAFRGFFFQQNNNINPSTYQCICAFEYDLTNGPFPYKYTPAPDDIYTGPYNAAAGEISKVDGDFKATCYRYTNLITHAPVTNTPTTHSPSTASPSSHSPSSVAPSTHAPVATLAPTTHRPSSLAPTSHSPTTTVGAATNKPTTHSPTSVAPSSHSPVATVNPTTHAPASAAPSSHSPSSLAPSSHSPISLSPTSHAPVSSSPVAAKSSKSAKKSKGGSKSTKNSKKL